MEQGERPIETPLGFLNASRDGGIFARGTQSSSKTAVTFYRATPGPFKTVRNFTKKPKGRRRSLQVIKLPDGKEDPSAKTRLTQDGENGEVASRNIAWKAVFAPRVPTEVIFTIVHSGIQGKGGQEGQAVEEFDTCTYTFTSENNTFDIDIEVLANKNTSLLKKRPSGLSIIARAQKRDSGELLGDSPPVAIQGPGKQRECSNIPCSTPFNSTSNSPNLFTPHDERASALAPSSNDYRIAVKPTPNRAGVAYELQQATDTQGYGFIPRHPERPSSHVRNCASLYSPVRGQSPSALLATDIHARLSLRPPAPVQQPGVHHSTLPQQPLLQQDFGEAGAAPVNPAGAAPVNPAGAAPVNPADGRHNKTVHSQLWLHSPLWKPRHLGGQVMLQDTLDLGNPDLSVYRDGYGSLNEEGGGTVLRKRPSCSDLGQASEVGMQHVDCLKARKLHSGDKDFSGNLNSDEDLPWDPPLNAEVSQEFISSDLALVCNDQLLPNHQQAMAQDECSQDLPDLFMFIKDGSQPGLDAGGMNLDQDRLGDVGDQQSGALSERDCDTGAHEQMNVNANDESSKLIYY